MAINLSTAGIRLYYATADSTTKKQPTTKSSYTELVGVKSIPDMNPAPDTIETTTLNETEWKTYVDGLKDLGGALDFTFNLTQDLITAWEALMTAYEAAKTHTKTEGSATVPDPLSIWFLIDIPGIANGFYFPGNPISMGIPAAEVSSALEITNRIVPTGAPVKEAKPTT